MAEASGVLSAIGTLEPLAKKVYSYISSNNEKIKIKEHIFLGLQNEILSYQKNESELTLLVDNKLIPSLEELNENYTITQINDLLWINSNITKTFGDLINSQVNFVIGCKNMTSIIGLMDDLQNTDKVLYNFMMLSKEIVSTDNKMVVDQRLYRFLLTYQNEIYGKIEDNDIENISLDMMRYISKIKNIVNPAIKKGIATRAIQKTYMKNIVYFVKANKRIKVDKSIAKDINNYVPNKLKPLIPIFDEIKKSIDTEIKRKKLEEQKKNKQKFFEKYK